MGYEHITNLYKDQRILLFRECWALEKVHGTSAHIGWGYAPNGETMVTKPEHPLRFFSGGESHERFVKLFDQEKLKSVFPTLGHEKLAVYGEAYGGKQQGMKHSYGEELRFIVFDVAVLKDGAQVWLSVPDAVQVVEALGLEFVPYEKVSTDLAVLDAIRDRPSEVAVRRGCGAGKPREGVVLRPLVEFTGNWGRVIAKHKQAAFDERSTPPKVVDPEKLKVLEEANAIAAEWVTPMRMTHVLDKLKAAGVDITEMSATAKIIPAMIEDVLREAKGEIVESKDAKSAIGKLAAQLFKERVTKVELKET